MKKKYGFTLIESLISISVLAALSGTAINYAVDHSKEIKILNHGNLPLTLIKAVDRRVEIDGYVFSHWASLPSANNTSDVLKFAETAFISRYNTECGLATGWGPVLDDAKTEKLISCSIKNNKYSYYDYQIKLGKSNEESLLNFDVIMRLNSKYSLADDEMLTCEFMSVSVR